jgi:hypothetical protein
MPIIPQIKNPPISVRLRTEKITMRAPRDFVTFHFIIINPAAVTATPHMIKPTVIKSAFDESSFTGPVIQVKLDDKAKCHWVIASAENKSKIPDAIVS